MILAIDIGGTYIKHGFVKTAEVFENGKFKTIFDFSELCRKIGELVTPDTEKICISSGGFWEKDGASLGYETIPEMKDKNLVGVLKEKYGVPVTVQNDARCALLCEKEYGALKNCKNGVLFVLGSSVGTAVLINGALYRRLAQKVGNVF